MGHYLVLVDDVSKNAAQPQGQAPTGPLGRLRDKYANSAAAARVQQGVGAVRGAGESAKMAALANPGKVKAGAATAALAGGGLVAAKLVARRRAAQQAALAAQRKKRLMLAGGGAGAVGLGLAASR